MKKVCRKLGVKRWPYSRSHGTKLKRVRLGGVATTKNHATVLPRLEDVLKTAFIDARFDKIPALAEDWRHVISSGPHPVAHRKTEGCVK